MTYLNKDINKNHWDDLNINYSNVWVKSGKKRMSEKEMGFINYFLNKKQPINLLDIGVGNGRILQNHIINTRNGTEIFGMDISDKMVDICKDKFKNESKIKEIKVRDVSKIAACFSERFDFITAIRILKYNEDWENIFKEIYLKLNSGGILIFDMLNKNSINKFSNYKIPIYRATKIELENKLEKVGFKVLDIKTFSRIPDLFYELSENKAYIYLLFLLEKLISIILGKTFLGRILFISVSKK